MNVHCMKCLFALFCIAPSNCNSQVNIWNRKKAWELQVLRWKTTIRRRTFFIQIGGICHKNYGIRMKDRRSQNRISFCNECRASLLPTLDEVQRLLGFCHVIGTPSSSTLQVFSFRRAPKQPSFRPNMDSECSDLPILNFKHVQRFSCGCGISEILRCPDDVGGTVV